MEVLILLLLLFASVLISLYLFYSLKHDLMLVERRSKLLATKVELSELRSKLHSVAAPKELRGPVELYYKGQKATVQATFLPKVYR